MKTGGAMLIIAVGLLALWVLVTGRLSQLQGAWNVLTGTATVAPAASSPFGTLTNLLTGTGTGTVGTAGAGGGTTAPLPIPTFPTTDQGSGGGGLIGQLLSGLGL